jgi:hypothetical protein
MGLYYILYNEIQRCFHYESRQENESRPNNGYQIVEKCYSLEDASKRTADLVEEFKNGYNNFIYGY